MSLNQPRLPPHRRKKTIKENIAKHTIREIALMCGVTSRTIDRDISEMKATGEWYEWIEKEFMRLHRNGLIEDNEKYRELAKLYGKRFTQKTESKTTIEGGMKPIIIEMYRPKKDVSETRPEDKV